MDCAMYKMGLGYLIINIFHPNLFTEFWHMTFVIGNLAWTEVFFINHESEVMRRPGNHLRQ